MEGTEEDWNMEENETFKKYIASAMNCWVQTIQYLNRANPQKKSELDLYFITQELKKGKKLLAKNEAKKAIYPIDFKVCQNQIQKLEALREVVENPREANWLRTLVEKCGYTPGGHLWEHCNGECPYFNCDCFEDCCSNCEKLVADIDERMYCAKCGKWYHLPCCKACTREEYDEYLKKKRVFDWVCDKCKVERDVKPYKSNPIRAPQPPPRLPVKVCGYGHLGIAIGRTWPTRQECSNDYVHRHPWAGICLGHDGAYAICLNGEYEDDVDGGNYIIYAGKGGPGDVQAFQALDPFLQIKMMKRGNASLYRSLQSKNPVRVIRGYKLKSDLAPQSGYRYDGLYRVIEYAYKEGMNKVLVHKFLLERLGEENRETPEDLKEKLATVSKTHPIEVIEKEFFKGSYCDDPALPGSPAQRRRSDSSPKEDMRRQASHELERPRLSFHPRRRNKSEN